MVLLIAAAAGCDDAKPSATVEPTVPNSVPVATPAASVTAPSSPLPVDAADVEVVYASRERQPPFLSPGDYDPLWGDLDADAPIIHRLLRAIAEGTPVEMDEELIGASDRSLAMNVRFRSGATWSVRQVRRCKLTSEGRMTTCLLVPDYWQLLHRNEVVVSTALTEWFERVQEYMPRVEYFELLPAPIILSERFAISGAGFYEGERVELSIEFSDGSVLPLGKAPLDHGTFRWDGGILEKAPTGRSKVGMRVLEGMKNVWGVTVSVTIVAPSRAGTATPPQKPVETEYSAADLAAWYESLSDIIWEIPGIAWTNLNEAMNRIDIGLYPRRGARDDLERVLAALDVPRKAIVIEDGCEDVSQWPHEVEKSAEVASLRAFGHRLEAVSQVAYGDSVPIKLTLQNISDEPVAFVLGGKPAYDFVVTTPDGEGVWFWKCGKITNNVLDGKSLDPREKLEFIGEWEQVNNRGEPVPPGTYIVRGVLKLGLLDSGPPVALVTEIQELEVLSGGVESTPTPTPTPEPILLGSASKPPEHIRLVLDDGIVVAFADDPSLGRIAYVTHVPSGAQIVLDREGKVIERHDSPGVGSDLLDATLKDADSMAKIQRSLRYEEVLLWDPMTNWVNVIHFGGASYHPALGRADRASTGGMELDQSELGPVVYRVAFCLSCNIDTPVGYQVQDGDATFLDPGTAIYGVNGYDPSERLAAIVYGEVVLYDNFELRSVSAPELAEVYAANPAGADAEYRGRDLSVTGTVHSVTQLFPNSALVVLRGNDKLNVGCFPGAWADYRDLSGPVTMFGVGEGLDFSMGFANGIVNLSHCEVVRPGEAMPVGRPSPKPTP